MGHLLQHAALLVTLALFHLVGPLPPELGVHGGALSLYPSPAHCTGSDWTVADPEKPLADLAPVIRA